MLSYTHEVTEMIPYGSPQTLFVEAGGVLKDEHPVTEIIPGETVTVRTSKGSFQTRRLVITVGPWAPKLLQSLRVELPYEVCLSGQNSCFRIPGGGGKRYMLYNTICRVKFQGGQTSNKGGANAPPLNETLFVM